MGAGAEGFAYDNERPRARGRRRRLPHRPPPGHERHVDALRRGRRLRAPRVVVATRAGRGRRSTTSPTIAAVAAGDPGRPRVPRLLVRGRRLRPRARCPPPHRSGVGEGGDLEPGDQRLAGTLAGVGQVWEWTASRVRRLPRVPRLPLPRVLRGLLRRRLPRPARRLVGHAPAGRDRHLPQLGPARSAGRSSPACGWPRSADDRRPPTAAEADPVDSHLDGRTTSARSPTTSLDGLTRPFKELPPKHFYDARGAELFDRICELPEYYPTRAERTILETRGAGDRGADRRRRAGRARLGHGRQDARAARRAARRRHAAPLRADRRDREHGARVRRGARRRVPGAAGPRHGRRLRAPLGQRARRRRARASSRSSAGRSATSRPAAAGGSCAGSRGCCGPGGRPAARHRPRQGPARARGRLQRQPRASRPSSTATCCACINRELDADFDLERVRARRVLRPEREWIEMRLRARARSTSRIARARPRGRTSPRARSCAPRSARSSPASAWRATSRRPGCELEDAG